MIQLSSVSIKKTMSVNSLHDAFNRKMKILEKHNCKIISTNYFESTEWDYPNHVPIMGYHIVYDDPRLD